MRDRVSQQIDRETWLQNCPIDYKFFLGNPEFNFNTTPDRITCPATDELILHLSPDDTRGGWHKVRALVQWAISQRYDYLFKCDVDTYVCVLRLLRSGFEQHDYVGPYGGAGYWLSRRAMDILSKSEYIAGLGEDGWVEASLSAAGIQPFRDARYGGGPVTGGGFWGNGGSGIVGPTLQNDVITVHHHDGILDSPVRITQLRRYHELAKGII